MRDLWPYLVALTLVVVACHAQDAGGATEVAEGRDYVAHGGFETEGEALTGWTYVSEASRRAVALDREDPHSGERCLRISPPPDAKDSMLRGISQRVEPAPSQRKLLLSAWVRTNGRVMVGVYVRAANADSRTVSLFTTGSSTGLISSAEWRRIETPGAVPADTTSLAVIPFLTGVGTAWIDDVQLVDAGPATEADIRLFRPKARLRGHALVLARGAWQLQANEDVRSFAVRIPIPLNFEDQAPLGLRIEAEPAGALLGYSLRERLPEDWIAELRFADLPAGERVDVTWESPVLLRRRDYSKLPKTIPYPDAAEIPEEVKKWLASTRCVQANDPRIQAKAKEVRDASPDLLAFARAAVKVPKQASTEKRVTVLDAVTALGLQGSCTSNANLVAALMRAAGVPARVLAGIPTWTRGIAMHYLVEFWAGGHGWVWAESSRGEVPCPSTHQVQVSIVYPEDEERSFRDFPAGEPYARWAVCGVPWMSLVEADLRAGLRRRGGVKIGDRQYLNQAVTLAAFDRDAPDLEAALKTARSFWVAYLPTKAKGDQIAGVETCVREMEQSQTPQELLAQIGKAMELL